MRTRVSIAVRLLLPSVLLLLASCAIYTREIGAPLSSQQVPDAEDGLELVDILSRFGPPQRLSSTANGFVLAYEHWRVEERKLGLSLRPIGIEFVNIDWGASRTSGEFLLLFFDRQHRLSASSYLDWNNEVGGGRSLTPIGSFVAVVDVDDLTRPMPQHRWGMHWLHPIPVMLNSHSHLGSGSSGIEQRGTPTGAGQHSLEFR